MMADTSDSREMSENERSTRDSDRLDDGRLARAKRRVHYSGVEFFESGSDGSVLWLLRRAWQWCKALIDSFNEWL